MDVSGLLPMGFYRVAYSRSCRVFLWVGGVLLKGLMGMYELVSHGFCVALPHSQCVLHSYEIFSGGVGYVWELSV